LSALESSGDGRVFANGCSNVVPAEKWRAQRIPQGGRRQCLPTIRGAASSGAATDPAENLGFTQLSTRCRDDLKPSTNVTDLTAQMTSYCALRSFNGEPGFNRQLADSSKRHH
jgi:hypothetical protein